MNKSLTPSSPILSYFFGKDLISKLLPITKPAASTSSQLPPVPDEDDEFTPNVKSTPMAGPPSRDEYQFLVSLPDFPHSQPFVNGRQQRTSKLTSRDPLCAVLVSYVTSV